MKKRYLNIFDFLKNIINEYSAGIVKPIRSYISRISNRKIRIIGDCYTTKDVPFGDGPENIQIEVIVDPTKHSHSDTINTVGRTEPIGNTVCKRTASGELISSGTNSVNTGFMLANEKDISSLFMNKTDALFTVSNEFTNSSNGRNCITNIELITIGNQFKLRCSYGDVENNNSIYLCRCFG